MIEKWSRFFVFLAKSYRSSIQDNNAIRTYLEVAPGNSGPWNSGSFYIGVSNNLTSKRSSWFDRYILGQ